MNSKENKKYFKTKDFRNGITLISLVITIIILLILIGITFMYLSGKNSIIKRAENTVDKTNEEMLKENIQFSYAESIMDYSINIPTEQYMQNSLEKKYGTGNVTVTKSGKVYKVKFKDDYKVYKLKSDGQIDIFEEMKPTDIYWFINEDDVLFLRATTKEGYTKGTSWTKTGLKKVIIEEKIAPTSTQNWFYNCKNLTKIENMENLHMENVENMSYMFYLCQSMTNIDVSKWDTSKAKNMSGLFNRCKKLEKIDVSEFDTSNVTDMSTMFEEATALSYIDVSGFDTSKVTKINNMFYFCYNLTSLDVSGFDTSKVENMSGMFYNCTKLKTIDVSGFDTSLVKNMSQMFNRCRQVTELNVKGFNTSLVTNMSTMFYECNGVTEIDVSGFDTSKVTNMSGMFGVCNNLKNLNLSNLFKINEGTNYDDMFTLFTVKIKANQDTINKLSNKFTNFKEENFELVK